MLTAQRQLEYWRNETQRPGRKGIYKARPDDVRRFARAIIADTEYATIKPDQITERIQQIADGFMNGQDTADRKIQADAQGGVGKPREVSQKRVSNWPRNARKGKPPQAVFLFLSVSIRYPFPAVH